ncbi:unnamed protein product [Somion occarium]|uniref:Uncharacterized protein n=1 Tax=Somion occarium TaxID=3059160 RepID=A0ABP1D6H3_9APHY
MSSAALRSTTRFPTALRRFASSQASASSNAAASSSKSSLPPHKLRALISLYHKSDKFITPDTLDEAIDRAFSETGVVSSMSAAESDYAVLVNELNARRKDPKIGNTGVSAYATNTEFVDRWSDTKSVREHRVQNALFGTEGYGRAGLEVLEEERERISKHLQSDRKS